MRRNVWNHGGDFMPCIERGRLIRLVERMDLQGGFAGMIGKAALLADDDNLKKLVEAFPKYFTENDAKYERLYLVPKRREERED